MPGIIEKIMQNVKAFPDHVVIVDQGEENIFTYQTFDAYARRIAARLCGLGVSRGDFVTIELPRSKEYIAAMYAVWLVGAAYAPLSPTYPPERLEYIRGDCGAKAVINENFLQGIEDEAPMAQTVVPNPADPSMLIYTSGSTGKPKGVVISFATVSDSVIRYQQYTNFPRGFRSALGAPLSFVVSVPCVFEPLYSGLTLYLMPYEAMRDPVLLADYIFDNQINFSFISPKMLKVFQPKGDSLKVVMTGSERVSDIWSDKFKILVGYGTTEGAGALTMFEIDKKYENTPIGKPIGTIRAHVLDENGDEAVEGELCLAGMFADGYLNLPEQTAKTFVENPFAEQDGYPKLLRTGDIVRRAEDGNIIFVNRKDWMVKINGQRVEPGEIEAIIKNADGIRDAALKDFRNQFGQVYLVAYYVEQTPVDPQALKEAIARKLPPYMIPAFFVKLDRLPVNANGKLDRSALTAPEAGNYKTEYIAPETELQKQLCAAFEEILGVENVGVDDDFFVLGGDSIKCAMVCARCAAYNLSTADLFAGKTPRGIERLLRGRVSAEKPETKQEKPRVYPLTSMERGMYLEQKMDEQSTVYSLNIAVIIHGAGEEKIKNALTAVFRAHEAFHSYYGEQDGLPVRILTDELPEIVTGSAASREEVLARIDGCAEPFDLTAGIPVRPTLYPLDDGSVILHLAIHHIAFDGGSADTFVRELIDGLNGREVASAEIDLSDLYEDRLNADHSSGLAFYRELFADGVPVNEMPIKGKRPKVHPLSDREIAFDFDSDRRKLLNDTARRFGVTEFELLFACVSMVLGKYTASEDVVLGIPTNLRPNGAENVIGMFVNTAPVRVKPRRAAEIADYLRDASAAVRSATYGAELPFEDIVAEFVKQRDESRNPIFDVSLNYMWYPPVYDRDGLRVELYTPLQRMGRDIGIVIRKNEGGLRFMVQYASELFEDAVVENFIEQLKQTLGLLENAKTVRDALALPARQKARLDGFSVEAEAEIPVTLLHRLFERSAAENADKTALIAKDATLTYRELNERANIVAHNLMAKGVKTGDSVALLLPRRSCFFACMFGVNKAGAAFIPCDPQYPADRINHIIADSEASYIITTGDKLSDYPADKVIDVEDILVGTRTGNPDIEMSDQELSYMIYTSGSTGKPKGVMLRHRGICNYLTPHPANAHIYYLKNHIHTYLSVTTVSFDMSFKEHTAALCNGKTLVFAAEDEMNDPRALAALMEKYDVDCINATPSRLQQYLDFPLFSKTLAGCRLIMSGGEGYPASLLEKLRGATDAQIFNTYGPTEITVSSNGANITKAEYITIGRPLLNYREFIVDKFGDLSPYGVMGELYIGGVGVAVGYKNLEEKTKEQFVVFDGVRCYRSGDWAKWDREGKVLIFGRMDSQVKLRGLRIELGEIQGLIEQQPHIDKVVVLVRKLNGQDNLCAYFTADTEIDIDALKEELKKHLTHYMVPSAYLQMDAMPISPNGKTDTKALPDPVPVSSGEYVPPANDTEAFFCDLFGKVLKLDKVGATDDFFEIGGTSLVVTSVVIDASDRGYQINYGDVFKHTTPRALAAFVSSADKAIDDSFLVDFSDYDYSKINALLRENSLQSLKEGESRPIGNILLTGPVGYMGAHVLAEYLTQETGTAYCLIRKGSYKSAKHRIRNMLFYYFGSRFEDVLEDRVVAFEGDVTDYRCFEPFEQLPVDTVFNCAANVKHFSKGTDIEDVNVGGVLNCIRLCLKRGARLIHFSTISVAGVTQDYESFTRTKLTEHNLYYGQTLNLKYTSSKLLAEREVLEAVAEKGLDGKVIRVGTLAARESDGEFQINYLTNNFMGRLRSYMILGCFPYSLYSSEICMGPIDTSVKAFLLLARTPKECCLYNAVNNHIIPLGDVIRDMNEFGIQIDFVEDAVFGKALNEAEQDPQKAAILSSMLAYKNMAHGEAIYQYEVDSEYTTQVLMRLGFFWNPTDKKYVYGFVKGLSGIGFFSDSNLSR